MWGEADCALFLADWVRARTGIDPAAHLRGRYADAAGAAALWGPLGLAGVVRTCARAAGLSATRLPGAGSVAVLRGDLCAVCAIVTDSGAVLRGDRALVRLPRPDIVLAFEVP